jgi:hypothetical protein
MELQPAIALATSYEIDDSAEFTELLERGYTRRGSVPCMSNCVQRPELSQFSPEDRDSMCRSQCEDLEPDPEIEPTAAAATAPAPAPVAVATLPPATGAAAAPVPTADATQCRWHGDIGLLGWLQCSGQAWAGLGGVVKSVVRDGEGGERAWQRFQAAVHTQDRRPFLLSSLGAMLAVLLLTVLLLKISRPRAETETDVEGDERE